MVNILPAWTENSQTKMPMQLAHILTLLLSPIIHRIQMLYLYAQSVISMENVMASVKATKRDACKNHVNFYFNWYSHFPLNTYCSFNLKEKETQQELINPAAVLTSKFDLKKKKTLYLDLFSSFRENSFFRRITVLLILGVIMALTSGSSPQDAKHSLCIL